MQRPWGRTMAGVVGGTARRPVRLEQSEQGKGGGRKGREGTGTLGRASWAVGRT